jgi:RHS repeat-associated protein
LYSYDGEGRRVTKATGSSSTVYVYDAKGDAAAEYGNELEPVAGTAYLTADHLGSARLVTDASGDVLKRYDYLPFGGEIQSPTDGRGNYYNAVIPSGPVNDTVNNKFTSKERDAETGLDYFGARYFSGAQGRWTSPDKVFADQNTADPQSWNMYAYVRNNPLRFTDADGRKCVGGADDKTGMTCFVATAHASWLGRIFSKIDSFLKGTGEEAVANPIIGVSNTLSTMTAMSGLKAPAQQPLLQPTNTAEQLGQYTGMIVPLFIPGGEVEETVTLFRAVSREEAAQALAEGVFKAGENSLGGKFFAETAEDATKWGNQLQGPGQFEVLQVQLPKSTADSLMRWERLDGIGPARYGELNEINMPGLRIIGK